MSKDRKPRHRDTMVTLRSGTSRAKCVRDLEFCKRLMERYPETWGKGWIETMEGNK